MKKNLVYLIFIISFFSTLYAQKISEKKDIAIFATSYPDRYIFDEFVNTNEFIEMVDDSIMNVFFNLERFNIIGLEYRLASNDVGTFIGFLQQSIEADTQLPESVLMGLEAFTKDDWEKTINSYYVVVPVITYYSIQKERYHDTFWGEIDGYRINLTLELHIYSSKEDLKEKIDINVNFIDKTYEKSCSTAFKALSDKLDLELRKIKEFTIKTGIIKAEHNTVHFELGKKMGIKLGDEYVILSDDGKEYGLIVVTKIESDFSAGLVLYSKNPLNLGDQIREIPRGRFEYRPYVLGEFGFFRDNTGTQDKALSTGINVSAARGFYRIRPCFGAELNIEPRFQELMSQGVPFSIFGGAEIGNTYFKRLQILPTVQFYYTMIITGSKDNIHIPVGTGIKAFVHTSYLVTKNFKIGGDIGIKIGASLFKGTGLILRFTAGAGVTIKL
ncbi:MULTISPECIES: hypothetical protein [unclassified Treponema]|uniref:hypothetical protein n=1 Tax=unclassified Treponema TaxID=2638727 RepID=UPI0020A5A92F|nr:MULTISPECIES: hypothetical protein [unclassified Treponema]UTC67213.1 hypothetical protein E4O06_00625 [Treponema sp. OMZ 789]UTC69942.1 hypothetical protein E4O01_00620 [Treponema sp. OMZ 790]UTC72657.1 hypothetical protein E4O02_00620 [Treponema sp. OMZ 791]